MRHPELRPGLVVEAVNGEPTHGALSKALLAQMQSRPVTISFRKMVRAVNRADEDLMASILAKKAEAEEQLAKDGSRFGRLKSLTGAAKERLKRLDERLDGNDERRLEPSVLIGFSSRRETGD